MRVTSLLLLAVAIIVGVALVRGMTATLTLAFGGATGEMPEAGHLHHPSVPRTTATR